MQKQEFLDTLRTSLSGRIHAGAVEENIRYYEDYINTEVRKGGTEEEVLSALGDPRLIARTIVEAGSRTDRREADDIRSYSDGGEGRFPVGRGRRLPAWVWWILAGLVAIIVLSAAFSIVAALRPILLPVLLVVLLVKLFKDWER